MSRWSQVFAAACAVVLVAAAPTPPVGQTPPDDCVDRVLVLGAMPLEIQPLLDAARLDPEPVDVGDHTFYTGRLSDEPVAIAMTGIGLVNAERTVDAAFDRFTCVRPDGERAAISGVVFSGVAGSVRSIADVTVPQRWTLDGGASWIDADRRMLAAARTLADDVELSDTVPVGDAACLCPGVETLATPVRVEHEPRLFVGGSGVSSDMFGGRALPCVPGGGDVFGCRPCIAPGTTVSDIATFANEAPALTDPTFLSEFLQPPAQTTGHYEAQDMETAAAAAAAERHGAPFLGIRAVSDGQGDPLALPGFPFQFFAYRNLAGDNAAAVTIAFLEAWDPPGSGQGSAPRV